MDWLLTLSPSEIIGNYTHITKFYSHIPIFYIKDYFQLLLDLMEECFLDEQIEIIFVVNPEFVLSPNTSSQSVLKVIACLCLLTMTETCFPLLMFVFVLMLGIAQIFLLSSCYVFVAYLKNLRL